MKPPKRLVYLFDFEEREKGNYEAMPRYWYVTGRGAATSDAHLLIQPLYQKLIKKTEFSSFTDVRFDDRHHVSGTHIFYLGVNGGNAGAYLEVGTLPAVPGSDYLVFAKVRTERL